jgi:hypothetical protein
VLRGDTAGGRCALPTVSPRHRELGAAVSAERVVPSRGRLLAVWVGCAVVLASVVIAGRVLRTAGDDVDPGRQRPGILDLGPLPEPAPDVARLDLPARRAVVFFAADDHVAELCDALEGSVVAKDEAVFLVRSSNERCAPRVTVVAADVSRAAGSFGLRRPAAAAVPTGYAIVDPAGRIRYRTLDPVAPTLLNEVATMVRTV